MNNVCRICFKDIHDHSIYNLINKNHVICEDCFHKMHAKFYSIKIANIKGLSIYDYDNNMKDLIYKYKGCYDYELKDVFLYRYRKYFKLIYRGYYVVPAPSYYIDDEKRGFNHVVEIFKTLGLEMLPIIHKNKAHKQSENNSRNRRSIISCLSIDENISLKGKNILLVDDILTTGSTLLSCIELLKQKQPKRIKILVIAKTSLKPK